MTPSVAHALLWLLVILLGTIFGAGIYEARIVVPMWASGPPASLHSPDSGRRFWAFVSTVPLTLVTLANGVFAWQAVAPQRSWWLAAVTMIVVERAMTFAYFIPTMIRLQRATALAEPALRADLAEWRRFNYLRNTVTLVAWVAALQAFALAPR